MSAPVSTASILAKNDNYRPSATYHPSIWREHFLKHSSNNLLETDARTQQEHEQMKQEVKRMLNEATVDISSKKLLLALNFIDAIQRLGVAYHFEREIEDALEKIYNNVDDVGCHLSTVSLWFRLLRQGRINVSSDVFEMFKDGEGKFKAELAEDVHGMLNLYEAAHLAIRGEDILDEALSFVTIELEKIMTTKANPQLAEQITHALNRPIRKGSTRIEARHYITVYPNQDLVPYNPTLLKFAKLDFNMLQSIHQKELSSITRWWTNWDFTTKLPYARDRVAECYFWINIVYFEPKYSLARTFLTKVIAIASILDDTYDNYATIEELEVFTKSIERWDISMINQLPEYMKLIYEALLDVYSEMEKEVAKEGRTYSVKCAKEAMKRLTGAYFVEAKWREEGYIPTMEEYKRNAVISSGYPMVMTNSFVGMGDIANEEVFDWISSDPKIVMACAIISRLMDDIVSHELEQKRQHVTTAVGCYMKQYEISKDEVIKLFRQKITNAWKDINQEYLKLTMVPVPLLTRVLNFARAMDVIYKDDDAYTNPYLLKDHLSSLFINSVPV